jgi:hypothetical protein
MMLVEDGEEILLTPVGFTWLRFHLKKTEIECYRTYQKSTHFLFHWNKTQIKAIGLGMLQG